MAISTKEAEILDAAARLFKEKGFHATSMQDIANAVGLQKGSLYYHIASKEELLFRISHAAISAIIAHLEEITQAPLSPTEKLRQAIENHVVTLCDRIDLLSVFLKESRTLTAEQQAQILEQRKRYEELFAGILREGIAAGEFRPVDVPVVTVGLLGMLNWMHQWYRPEGRLSPQQIADIFIDLALRGLLAPMTDT
jgi:AcrR family transcriptional regulator